MSQNIERAEAIKKIAKLREQTIDRGRTEQEAMMAMTKMANLLETFNITMDEIDLSMQECKTLKIDTGSAIDQPINKIIVALGQFTDCIVWNASGKKDYARDAVGNILRNKRGKYKLVKGNKTHCFYGLESDTLMTEHLYSIISDAMKTELKAYKRSSEYLDSHIPKKSLSHAFQYGMAYRLSDRLYEMRSTMLDNIERERAALGTNGNDIMVLKTARVEEQFKTTGMKLRSRNTSSRVRHHSGFYAGSAAADKVNLSRPITSASASAKQIGHG